MAPKELWFRSSYQPWRLACSAQPERPQSRRRSRQSKWKFVRGCASRPPISCTTVLRSAGV